MARCPKCNAELGDPMPLACVNCGAIFVKPHPVAEDPAAAPPASPSRLCANCKVEMDYSGDLNFRVGGYTGGSGFLLGGWNQLSEKLQPFAIYHCPHCGKIDLYESVG